MQTVKDEKEEIDSTNLEQSAHSRHKAFNLPSDPEFSEFLGSPADIDAHRQAENNLAAPHDSHSATHCARVIEGIETRKEILSSNSTNIAGADRSILGGVALLSTGGEFNRGNYSIVALVDTSCGEDGASGEEARIHAGSGEALAALLVDSSAGPEKLHSTTASTCTDSKPPPTRTDSEPPSDSATTAMSGSGQRGAGARHNVLNMTAEERAAYVAEQKRVARERGRWKAQQMEAQRRFGLRSGARAASKAPDMEDSGGEVQGGQAGPGAAAAGEGTASGSVGAGGRAGVGASSASPARRVPMSLNPRAATDGDGDGAREVEAARAAQHQRERDRTAMQEVEQQRLANERAERERRAADERAREAARLLALREAQARVEAEGLRQAAAAEEERRAAEARRATAEEEARRRLEAEVAEGDRLYREAQVALDAARFAAAGSLADAADAAYARGGVGGEAREVRLLGLRQSIRHRERAERERREAAAAARRRAEEEYVRLEEAASQAREAARREQARRQAEVTLWEVSRSGRADAMQGLLSEEPPVVADVDARDGAGNTPLLVACREGHAGVVEVLLQHGAALAATNRDGMGVLHMAFGYGHDALGRLLLARGADPAVVNRAGQDYRACVTALARPPADRAGPAAVDDAISANESPLDEIKRQLFQVSLL